MGMKPNIELHIEELVLLGFAPGDRYRIGAAVERELAWLLEQGEGLSLAQSSEITFLDGGRFEVARDSKAETVGAQIARAVYGGLSL